MLEYIKLVINFKIAEVIIDAIPFLVFIGLAWLAYIGAVMAEKIHGLFVK